MADYNNELRKIMQDKSPVPSNGMTLAQIEAAINDISLQLKGPLSNAERLMLVEDRAKLRRMNAHREGE